MKNKKNETTSQLAKRTEGVMKKFGIEAKISRGELIEMILDEVINDLNAELYDIKRQCEEASKELDGLRKMNVTYEDLRPFVKSDNVTICFDGSNVDYSGRYMHFSHMHCDNLNSPRLVIMRNDLDLDVEKLKQDPKFSMQFAKYETQLAKCRELRDRNSELHAMVCQIDHNRREFKTTVLKAMLLATPDGQTLVDQLSLFKKKLRDQLKQSKSP